MPRKSIRQTRSRHGGMALSRRQILAGLGAAMALAPHEADAKGAEIGPEAVAGTEALVPAIDPTTADYLGAVLRLSKAHARLVDHLTDEMQRAGYQKIDGNIALVLASIRDQNDRPPIEIRKMLVADGYVADHGRDAPAPLVLTAKGQAVVIVLDRAVTRVLSSLRPIAGVDTSQLTDLSTTLQRLDRHWHDTVLYRL